MKVKFSILFLIVQWNLIAQTFDEILIEVSNLPRLKQEEYFNSYLESQSSLPLKEGDNIIFITRSDGGQPFLLADFNGFLNPRYTKDNSIGLMKPVGSTSWFYFKKKLRPDAVINYKYTLDDQEWLDAYNPNSRDNFGDKVSFVSSNLADTKISTASIPKKGKLISLTVESEIQKHSRTIHVYTPPDFEDLDNLPSVYFHDGSFFTNDMEVPEILDFLISNEIINPVVAIFDNPVIRGKEYRGDTMYLHYIENELIPYISENYKVAKSKDQRAVIGFSRGGMSAFYLTFNTSSFSKLGALSPAIFPKEVDEFIEELDAGPGKPNQIFITGSFYDHFWYQDASDLKRKFKNRDIKVDYIENAQGHNIPSWQTQIDNILIAFFKKS